MSCRRSLEIELSDFLLQPGAEAFADFRDHYPRCRECAAEVRAWTELHERLAAGGAAHPDPATWVRYHEAPGELAQAQRVALDRHLEGCPVCRDELAALASFSPASLAAATRAPEQTSRSLSEAISSWLDSLRRLVLHPAFAYALVGLLLLPVIQRVGLFSLGREDRAPQMPSVLSERVESVPADAFQDRKQEKEGVVRDEAFATRAVEEEEAAKMDFRSRANAPPPLESPLAKTPAPLQAEAAPESPGTLARRVAEDAPRAAQKSLAPAPAPAPATSDRDALRKRSIESRRAHSMVLADEAPVPTSARWVALRSDQAEVLVPAPGEVEIRVPLPAGTSGALEVRIADVSRTRELRERFSLPAPERFSLPAPERKTAEIAGASASALADSAAAGAGSDASETEGTASDRVTSGRAASDPAGSDRALADRAFAASEGAFAEVGRALGASQASPDGVAGRVSMRVPSTWLEPGVYRVEVHREAAEPTHFELIVVAP